MLPKFYWQLLGLFAHAKHHYPASSLLESRLPPGKRFLYGRIVQGMKERYKCRSVSNFGNCAWKNGSFATRSYAAQV